MVSVVDEFILGASCKPDPGAPIKPDPPSLLCSSSFSRRTEVRWEDTRGMGGRIGGSEEIGEASFRLFRWECVDGGGTSEWSPGGEAVLS